MNDIDELKRHGLSIRAISRITGYCLKTIIKCITASSASPLTAKRDASIWTVTQPEHHRGIPAGARSERKILIHFQDMAPVVEVCGGPHFLDTKTGLC